MPSMFILSSTNSITYSSSTIYIYTCMKLTQITTNSYSYKLQQVQQPNAGYERLWFSADSAICDTSVSIPTIEFHVLVKQGMADSAAITFPDKLLFSADYKYMTSTGAEDCDTTSDTMDMCTDKTALSFNNYTNCKQEIAYSADFLSNVISN
ncbi:uncharacterized protein LOC132733927 [Ruditapes philippinarum]|uniref:uncharacterized protein LOC132733927 n=1 Tax=Ruditapes philippinarum TaxID=129788 RepID=UPI00295BAAD9|nr:uncharacterized protein LOC132733927 [Ruditapes philippinarum]